MALKVRKIQSSRFSVLPKSSFHRMSTFVTEEEWSSKDLARGGKAKDDEEEKTENQREQEK